jgi:hypothetical protein
MTREEMIKKATEVLHVHRDDEFEPYVSEMILDAILPQVTTVEELRALPDDTLLINDSGSSFRWFSGERNEADIDWWIDRLPMTVVWVGVP